MENNKNSEYCFDLKRVIELPKYLKEQNTYNYDIDCFSVEYEKNSQILASGKEYIYNKCYKNK